MPHNLGLFVVEFATWDLIVWLVIGVIRGLEGVCAVGMIIAAISVVQV